MTHLGFKSQVYHLQTEWTLRKSTWLLCVLLSREWKLYWYLPWGILWLSNRVTHLTYFEQKMLKKMPENAKGSLMLKNLGNSINHKDSHASESLEVGCPITLCLIQWVNLRTSSHRWSREGHVAGQHIWNAQGPLLALLMERMGGHSHTGAVWSWLSPTVFH